MTSELYFQDDSIQLIEIASNKSSADNINRVQSPSTSGILKKKNKIQSPTVLSTEFSGSPSSGKISDVFLVKQNIKPLPKPRTLKPVRKQSNISKSTENQENIQENPRKLSETIESTSEDIQSIFSQKSEISYKEKLRNRFLTIKKQAEISIQNEKSQSRKTKLAETIEAILQNEESQIKHEFNKHVKNKLHRNIDTNTGYDFFCKENEVKTGIKEDDKIESAESSAESISEFLGIDPGDDVTELVLPNLIDVSLNEKRIFKPFKRSNKRNNEINYEVRNFEDEGIYKPKISHISKYQLNILENRLIEDNRDWFDIDGQLKILPDPRLDSSFKPFKSKINHSDFVEKYVPPALYEPAENYINIFDNTLELILNQISFKHHPLFSSEHVLAQKLFCLFNGYKELISQGYLIISIKKLDALRCAKKRLEEIMKESGECNENQLKRYEKYLSEISSVREKVFTQGQKERSLKKSILFVWKSLKNLRKSQKYSSTDIKLIITKENVDYNNDYQIWQKNLEETTSEILEKHETIFENEINEYKKQLKQWKLQQKQLQDDEIQNEKYDILDVKPKKPKKNFSREQIENYVKEKCNESFKQPGEPNIDFEIKFDNEITENIENVKEKLRRNDVKKTEIFLKVLCNQREICKSKSLSINEKFICNFNENISIKLLKIPTVLTVQIYEQFNFSKRLLTDLSVGIPDFNCVSENFYQKREYFGNFEIINFKHNAVGTGIELNKIIKLEGLEDDKLFCNGVFDYQLGWTSEKNIDNLMNFSKNSEVIPEIPTLFDIENLENWVKNYPDPQDPKNALLFDYIKNLEHETDAEKDYFRCDPEMAALEFCSFTEIENNPRFKLLTLRNNNEPEFKEIVVPNRIKEISENIFHAYEKRKKEEVVNQDLLINHFQEDNNIDAQRKWAKKFLEQVENKIIQLSKIAERKITLKDVLSEDVIPTIGSLGTSFLNWLQPKRPLRPVRKPIKQTTSLISFKEMHILVNIVGAIQVPARKDQTINEQSSSRKEQMDIVSVRPFVVVSFRDVSAKTTVAEGPNPIWNQELNLPFRNKNEILTTTALQNIQEFIIINLYDETLDDLILDDRVRDTNIHQQLGCNWLGYIKIPFNNLLYNNRIEGTFKINLPEILLGYERQTIKSFQSSGELSIQKIDTFLTVFVTLQPHVSNIQHQLKNELKCNELEYIEDYITNWQNQFNTLHPQRQFSSLVTTMNGENCCITKFFQPVLLPQFVENSSAAERQCAKFVSLIPFRENKFSGLIPDIWLTPNQLLMLMMGSRKDHAVLLNCYFMSLELKSWLLLGYGLCDGFTAYVLVQEKGIVGHEFFIYDVKSGQKFNIYDNICPLNKVFCVINNENVWANIQCDDRIHQTNFDFTKSSDWLPLFNKEISVPSSFQQINPIYYDPPSVEVLQEKIETKLRKKIMNWRKFSRTIWNHYCNASFRKILAKFEANSLNETDFSETSEYLLEMQQITTSHQVRGFVVSFPYTTIADIVDFVQKTGIHLNDNPKIEFSLAVHASSYNNNAVNILLYIATLLQKR